MQGQDWFENKGWTRLNIFKQKASIASFRHGMPESRLTRMSPEASLRIWMPPIHAGTAWDKNHRSFHFAKSFSDAHARSILAR
jgi:hypothetical protein